MECIFQSISLSQWTDANSLRYVLSQCNYCQRSQKRAESRAERVSSGGSLQRDAGVGAGTDQFFP